MDSARKVLNLNTWFVPSFSSSLGKWTQLKESCDTEAVLPYNGRETTPTHLNAEDIKWISMHSSQTLELKDCSAVSNHYNTFRFFQWEWTLLVFCICLPFSQCQTNLRHQEVMEFRDSTLIKAAKFQGKRKLLSGWSLSSLGEDVLVLKTGHWIILWTGLRHFLLFSPISLHRNTFIFPSEWVHRLLDGPQWPSVKARAPPALFPST